jgi:hypothetical protein
MCSASRAARKAGRQARKDASVAIAKQEQSYKEMLAMIPEPPKPAEYTPMPTGTRSTLDDSNTGVRTAKSKRKSTLNMNKGVGSLRIPLNTGSNSAGGGINIG